QLPLAFEKLHVSNVLHGQGGTRRAFEEGRSQLNAQSGEVELGATIAGYDRQRQVRPSQHVGARPLESDTESVVSINGVAREARPHDCEGPGLEVQRSGTSGSQAFRIGLLGASYKTEQGCWR